MFGCKLPRNLPLTGGRIHLSPGTHGLRCILHLPLIGSRILPSQRTHGLRCILHPLGFFTAKYRNNINGNLMAGTACILKMKSHPKISSERCSFKITNSMQWVILIKMHFISIFNPQSFCWNKRSKKRSLLGVI